MLSAVVTDVAHEPIEREPGPFGNHRAVMMGIADARFGLDLMDSAISSSVPAQHVGHDIHRHIDARVAGREIAGHVAAQRVNVRFVDGAPQRAVFLERIHCFAHEFFEQGYNILMLPAAFFIQPERIGEMVQGDHRRHAALFQAAQHGAIAFQCVFVPALRFGLDAAPFYRKAVRVLTALGGAVEILAPASAAPPIAGQTRFAICMAFLLPLPPLVIGIVALHLMGRGGRAP